MRDAADATRTGDMAEARRMSAAAESSLEQAASSLDQDARMFPGHNNETCQRAQADATSEASSFSPALHARASPTHRRRAQELSRLRAQRAPRAAARSHAQAREGRAWRALRARFGLDSSEHAGKL
jgi:hypothetical protein